ncbi:hypothetical protein GOODEAATRI_032009, partial [Goodea atripinnis]
QYWRSPAGESAHENMWAALKRAFLCLLKRSNLTSEAVQGAALPLQSVNHIHGGDGLPLGVLGVGDGVTDHVLQEHLQHTAGLLVDETGDALDSPAASQTADSGLGDSLDVITENFTVTLGASFPESFASLSSATHLTAVSDKLTVIIRRAQQTPYSSLSCGREREQGKSSGSSFHVI